MGKTTYMYRPLKTEGWQLTFLSFSQPFLPGFNPQNSQEKEKKHGKDGDLVTLLGWLFQGGTLLGPPDSVVDVGNTEVTEEIFLEYLSSLGESLFRWVGTGWWLFVCSTRQSNPGRQSQVGRPWPSAPAWSVFTLLMKRKLLCYRKSPCVFNSQHCIPACFLLKPRRVRIL